MKIISLIILCIPILFLYVLSTVGFLGLGWILGEYESVASGKLDSNYYYRVTSFGIAISSPSGRIVHIYYSPKSLPFLEKEVFTKLFEHDYYYKDPMPTHVTFKNVGNTSDSIGLNIYSINDSTNVNTLIHTAKFRKE